MYIPISNFCESENKSVLKTITTKYDTYIYLPRVINMNYSNILNTYMVSIIKNYKIKGIVISNIGQLELIKDEKYKDFEIISDYSMNVYNDYTMNELSKHGISSVTLSPELTKDEIQNIHAPVDKELVVYGKQMVMITKYCLLSGSSRMLSKMCKKM